MAASLTGPIRIVDCLKVRPGCEEEVIERLARDYAPMARERKLRQLDLNVLPPVSLSGEPASIVVHWEYPSLSAFWSARGIEESDSRICAFWNNLAPLLVTRSRSVALDHFLGNCIPEEPAHLELGGRPRFIALATPASPAATSATLAAHGLRGGYNDKGYTFRPGDLTIELSEASPPLPDSIGDADEIVRLIPRETGLRDPNLAKGVKRTVLFRTVAGATPAQVELLEQRLKEFARLLPEMLNWTISRVAVEKGATGWTHCFEQEFATADDVTGPYLDHPYHWAVVDRLFHPEAPERIVDGYFHSIYAIDRSVLAEFASANRAC